MAGHGTDGRPKADSGALPVRTRIVAVSMMKNEADVAVGVVERLLAQGVDRVLVSDNASTDGTRDLLADLARGAPVDVFDDPDPRFLQAEKMTALAERAYAAHRARWILPFDADEWWTLPRRLPFLGADARSTSILNYVCTGLDDPLERDPLRRMRWRHPMGLYHKVIVRWRPGYALEIGNHYVLRKARRIELEPLPGLELRHFAVRSLDHMIRKYGTGKRAIDAAGEAIRGRAGFHWRELGQLVESGDAEAIRARFEREFFVAEPRGALVLDPVRP
jgi:glycosyltransferase involved in cell wall biosynthesis